MELSNWLLVDDAYQAQMAERERLISNNYQEVVRLNSSSLSVAQEALEYALGHAPSGFEIGKDSVTRPDKQNVPLDFDAPLDTLGHLFQEDFCLMEKPDGAEEHILTGAVLCFPSNWRLAEKLDRPMIGIHDPVPSYDSQLAKRVQRLLDAVKPDRPLWRFNAHEHPDPALFQPQNSPRPRPKAKPGAPRFLRSERQCLVRLPKSNAVLFSIHTYVLRLEDTPS